MLYLRSKPDNDEAYRDFIFISYIIPDLWAEKTISL